MSSIARFGVFELNLRTGELRKQGVRLKLQGKAFRLLQALIERPGQVVTRDELRERLWSSGVFVDTESGLNTAANRLRLTLGDSAESPRYVETLARTGYRFVAPVEIVEVEPSHAPAAPAVIHFWRRSPLPTAVGLAALALAISVTAVAFRRPAPSGFQFRQITFRHGQVGGARFAPDGHAILYSAGWD